ncbi:N-acetylglucosamine kinase [Jeotgalibacillus soli]|uniref:ATPase BadF/BadG/BcrA/BcrD type domain-containing protein n=1 Tax=Jeotgalibacillus soli TaxID=889306 RepID=A0A0C2VKZ5_9BACL|nr:BadF/BadG/BcrA/BcrD ATPase family protein [Jeotgalibacillus soli]KIL49547.1 hypothetical protein KP78_10150 [Jeotgalibacillus soli]
MPYVIGIDGGGTKTKAVLLDETGKVYAVSKAGPSNPTAVPSEQLKTTLQCILVGLQLQAPNEYKQVKAGFAGMSGAGDAVSRSHLKKIFFDLTEGRFPIWVDIDAINALYAGTLGKPGILQIAGTGAITYGLNKEGECERVGGWGYLFDDQGSGYHISVKALSAVMQAYDGRGKATLLTKLLIERFSITEVPELISAIYRSDNSKTVIASLSPVVLLAAEQKDEVANHILSEAAEDLALSIMTLHKKLFGNAVHQKVILTGGFIQHSPLVVSSLKALFLSKGYAFDFQFPRIDPAGGSAIAALHYLNEMPKIEFVSNFHASINTVEEGGVS